MPNGFRISGDLYVSKVGDDLNAGTDPNAPKKTIQGALDVALAGNTIVIGCGDYTGGAITSTVVNLISDGIVVLRSNSVDNFQFLGVGSTISADQTGNFKVIGFNSTNLVRFNNSAVLTGLVLENCEIGSGVNIKYTALNVTYVSSFNNVTVQHRGEYDNCTFLDSNLGSGTNQDELRSCYIDATSNFDFAAGVAIGNFTDNNIQGAISIGGTPYALHQDSNGSPVTPTPPDADLIAIYPDIYTTRASFNQDAAFFNAAKRDYHTVLASSPNLREGLSLSNIGGVVYGSGYNTSSSDFYIGIGQSNTQLIGGDVTVIGSVGTFTTGALLHSPQTFGRIYRRIIQSALLNFDSDQAAGTAGNNNVMLVTNHGGGTAGENPQRLTVEMRYTTIQNPDPLVDSDWNNDFSISGLTAESFYIWEVGGLAVFDNSFRTSGDPAYDSSQQNEIRATYYQYRVTLRDGI